MQANEVPEKIYRTTTYLNSDRGKTIWKSKPVPGAENIEYTRTDAFIEKAKKYLEERFINEVSIIAGGPVVIHFNQAFDNFIKYMKGE